jgi:ankyrin repeat protein
LQAIQNLPPDLDQMYNRILGQIDEADVPYAIRILRWLTFAPRPLYLTEVAEVAGLDPDRCPAFDRDEILQDPSDVLTICSSLVNIADQGKMEYSQSADRDSSMGSCVSTESDIDSDLDTEPVVVLAHYSVKEYLVSERIFDSKAKLWSMNANLCHQTLAKSCVQYLLQMATADLSHYELALADYSVDQWIYHYNSVQNPDPDLQELVVQLFKDKDAFSNMVYFARASGDEMSWPGVGHLPEPLFIACDYGLLDVVQRLVSETDVDINESKRMPTILEVASARGDLSIVRFLLEQGATAKDDALRSASRYGQLQVVRLLVEQGAQINAHGVNCPSALQWASYSGHFGVLQYLVENGAETGNLDEIAICRASLGGHLAIVRIMVENSANTNGSIGRNGHALYCASYGNHLELVKYLVKIGAEVNAKCSGKYGTALLAASARGSFEVVQCLVEGGADINAQCDNEHGGALMAATTIGRLDIVRYLVERGADVNAIGSRQADNALEAASVRGHMNIVQYLVEHGADVNIKTTWPEAPLTSWGDIVQYLIEHRDDTIAAAGNDVS